MNDERRLESWKEIGMYLQKDLRTARRWEKEEGLPVHRHSHKARASVYAFPIEIDAWRASRKVVPEPVPMWKTLLAPHRLLALATTVALCLVMVGNGVRPASAQQAGTAKGARQIWTGASVDGSGTVSLDGRLLSFTNWETGDLALRDLKAGTSRLLTNTRGWIASGDYTEQSVISPDSKHIAYHWFVQSDLKDQLRVLALTSGATPKTLYSSERGRTDYMTPWGWTPDGKQVLVVHTLPDRTSQIAMVSVEDRSVRVIKSIGWQSPRVRLSPDGRYLAYDLPADDKNLARDIFILAVDGSRETPAVQGPSNDFSPMWSPDSSRLLFISDRTGTFSLWSLPIEAGRPTGAAELVKADIGNISPLGVTSNGTFHYSYLGSGGTNVYSAELGGGAKNTPVLATERFVNSNVGPSLSPDGESLAYYSTRPASAVVLVVRTLKTGEERDLSIPLPMFSHFGAGPGWFPDGHSVLVTARDPQRPGVSFYRVDLASGNREFLHHTGPLQGYKLAPDGKSLFYTANDDQETERTTTRLIRFDIETRRETELQKGQWFIAVAVSPDSAQLAYLVSGPGAASFLAVMPAAGGPAREVFRSSPWIDGSRYNDLAWTPDQRNLIFVRGGVGATSPNLVWRVPLTGGSAEQVGITMRGQIRSPQLHPDGHRIFFSANQGNASEVWALENFLPVAGK